MAHGHASTVSMLPTKQQQTSTACANRLFDSCGRAKTLRQAATAEDVPSSKAKNTTH
jgi:hypothetical protein